MDLTSLQYNVFRARSWLTLLLCVATLAAPFLLRRVSSPLSNLRRCAYEPLWLPMWAGLAAAVAHYGYSWFVAYTDGRMFWPIFCFAIPIAVHMTARPVPARTDLA